MRKLLFESLMRTPADRAAARADDAALAELAQQRRPRRAAPARPHLSIREVDAGSCNGCELEIHALNNAFYDLERFGLRFVASPRHADVLMVTGPVTKNMREALERTYNADARSQMGRRGRRLRARRRHLRRQLRGRRRRRGGGAGRPAHPRLPAASGAIAQGPVGVAGGRDRGLTYRPIPRPQEKGWNRTGSGPASSLPVPLHTLQTTGWPRSLTRPVPLHLEQRRLFVRGSSFSIGDRLPNAIFNSFAWRAHDGRGL